MGHYHAIGVDALQLNVAPLSARLTAPTPRSGCLGSLGVAGMEPG